MHFISHSRFIFVTSMNGRMDLIEIMEALSGTQTGPRTIQALAPGCINGVQGRDIVSVLVST
jgi:hypothetical protein